MAKHKTVPKGAYTKKYYVAAVTDQQAGDKVIYRTDGTILLYTHADVMDRHGRVV